MKKVFIVLTAAMMFMTSSVMLAEDTGDQPSVRAVYASFGKKALPSGSRGSGMSYGAGFKKGALGMAVYQTDYNTMPAGMERSSASFNSIALGAGTRTGETVNATGGAGFDVSIFVPLGHKRVELYAGPTMAFENESEVWTGAGPLAMTTDKIGRAHV